MKNPSGLGNRRLLGLLAVCLVVASPCEARADSPGQLENKARGALSRLFRQNRQAAENIDSAYAVIVFPEARKISLGLGVTTATGVLFEKMKPFSFHNLTAFSLGLELGIQKFGYAIFFMNEEALDYLYDSRGFEIGSSPSLVIADGIFSGSKSTTTQRPGILTFAFSHAGLALNVGVHIAKITEYEPSE